MNSMTPSSRVEEKRITLWEVLHQQWLDKAFYGNDQLYFRGTSGAGDFNYALNVAYMKSFINQKPTQLTMHWFHDKDYQYHHEDPENIIEKFNYVHNHMMWKHMVSIEHIFNSDRDDIWKGRYINLSRGASRKTFGIYNIWPFCPSIDATSIPKKLVLWRPQFNIVPNTNNGKDPLTNKEWEDLLTSFEILGYSITEIDYRTPIREVFYHIRTAELCVSYEGMWHYIAKNFFKPSIVVSEYSVTHMHTPYALQIKPSFIQKDPRAIYVRLPELIQTAMLRSESAKTVIKGLLTGFQYAN